MIQWEYEITLHELPKASLNEREPVIQCDQSGQCFVHDTFGTGIEWLESLFRGRGELAII